MNSFLVAAVLISSLALVRADGADEKLKKELEAKGFPNLSVMGTQAQEPLKEAMDEAYTVSAEILSEFTHVFYFTTNAKGDLTSAVAKWKSGELKFAHVAVTTESTSNDADDAFIKSAPGFVHKLLVENKLEFLKEGGYKVGVESGNTGTGDSNHVVFFAKNV